METNADMFRLFLKHKGKSLTGIQAKVLFWLTIFLIVISAAIAVTMLSYIFLCECLLSVEKSLGED